MEINFNTIRIIKVKLKGRLVNLDFVNEYPHIRINFNGNLCESEFILSDELKTKQKLNST